MERTGNNCRYSQFTRENRPQYAVRGPTWGDHVFPTVGSVDWCGEWAVVLPYKARGGTAG